MLRTSNCLGYTLISLSLSFHHKLFRFKEKLTRFAFRVPWAKDRPVNHEEASRLFRGINLDAPPNSHGTLTANDLKFLETWQVPDTPEDVLHQDLNQ